MNHAAINHYMPSEVEIIERLQETSSIFTLKMQFTNSQKQQEYRFQPGQFNMLYLYGVGEIPISIVSDPQDENFLEHTIRDVGRVSHGLAMLKPGDKIGIRGPYGRGWPIIEAQNKDVILVTGGLGCAPLVSVIHYVVRRRNLFNRLVILQGVKHSDDLIWRDQYEKWQELPNTQVMIAASQVAKPGWPWYSGHVTNLLDKAIFNADNAIAMMCGPEMMMHAAIEPLRLQGMKEENIWLSMERNMQCAVGHCGHCQYGDKFVCKQGPVFPFSDIKNLFTVKGF